jgi:hypothetical protein
VNDTINQWILTSFWITKILSGRCEVKRSATSYACTCSSSCEVQWNGTSSSSPLSFTNWVVSRSPINHNLTESSELFRYLVFRYYPWQNCSIP